MSMLNLAEIMENPSGLLCVVNIRRTIRLNLIITIPIFRAVESAQWSR